VIPVFFGRFLGPWANSLFLKEKIASPERTSVKTGAYARFAGLWLGVKLVFTKKQ